MIIFFEKKRVGLLAMIILTVLISSMFPVEVFAEEGLSMYSGSYALSDAGTGRVLTGKNETEPMANASTTKILTCIVTLENCSLDETVTISANAAAQPKVRLGMKEGETYPLKDMVYALMLESYNDCAVAIAEHVAGSEEAFAAMMNQKALEIGCKDTYFITPNGLDREKDGEFHHTTAEDLCKIMAYCVWQSPMKETFLEITQTANYSGNANGKSYSLTNRNAFLHQMDGVLSGKTGFTSKAGYCYVAALEREGERYCIALLACGWPNNKTYKWKDAATLFNYGLENYEVKKFASEQIYEELSVNGAVGECAFENINRSMQVPLYGESREREVLLKDKETIEKEIVLYADAGLPIEKGQVLGECNLYLEEVLLESVPLVSKEEAKEWTFRNILITIYKKFLTIS